MNNDVVAAFEKVSYDQFQADMLACFPGLRQDTIAAIYDQLRLPERATEGSAGYDFFMPGDLSMVPGSVYKFPTGIRCKMQQGWVLTLFPKSGLSFKYGTKFVNVIPVIDSDYYASDNEGHILFGMTVDQPVVFAAGRKIAQGIFLPFGITENDHVKEQRNGGFGSTGK